MRILTIALFSLSIFAQDAQKLDSAVQAYADNKNFIGSVLVAKGGRIVLEKGYGMANIELGVPNTPDTKFRLGSITKQFTSTAILQLQEQGKLSVKDLACKYIDGCPEAWKPITIYNLLTHTSGIPSYTADREFVKPKFMRVPLTPVEIVMLSKDKPLEFEPGSKYNYDNTGYVFLGAIIEKVSGEKYADYLRKHVFGPVDMADSGYDQTTAILKNRAAGYGPGGPGGALLNAEYLDMSLPYAAGSLYSTVRDLYRWDRTFYTEKLLSKESKEAMSTPFKNNYGFGLQVGPMAKHKQLGHGGGINGFSSYIARFPDDDAVVIVLSNNAAGGAGAVAGALAGTLFGEDVTLPGRIVEVTLDPKILDRHVGVYDAPPMVVTITNENGRLMVQPKGQSKLQLHPLSESKFYLKEVDATLTFVAGDDGRSKELHLLQNGQTLIGKRIN